MSASPVFTTLASFSTTLGASPLGALAYDGAGHLFGTTQSFGAGSTGTLYRFTIATQTIDVLADFSAAAGNHGWGPVAGVIIGPGGALFGTADGGGAHQNGTVYGYVGLLGLFTVHDLNAPVDGGRPQGNLVADAAGNLYGTTFQSGPGGAGTVFEIFGSDGSFHVLHSFSGNDSITISPDGSDPTGALVIDAAGNLYGMAAAGGAGSNRGVVFELAAGTRALSVLHEFDFATGAVPGPSLTIDAAGNLYGTTRIGGSGPGAGGTVFEIAAGTHAYSVLHSFGANDGTHSDGGFGAIPRNAPIVDADGNLFGTTAQGGSFDQGTVYRIDAVTHLLTTLHSFTGTEGANPYASLTADGNGTLYGTVTGGGANLLGALFSIADAGYHVTPTPLIARDDATTAAYNTAKAIDTSALLANDSSGAGYALSVTGVSAASHGTVSISGGSITFTPHLGYVGAAGFAYTADDGRGHSATAQVAVTVGGPGGATTAPAYIYGGGGTAPATVDFTGDTASHMFAAGSGDTLVTMGAGGGSVRLGAGDGTVIGGAGKDTITFGPGLGTVTGGPGGLDTFIFVKGEIADPAAHGGRYDMVTDFRGAGPAWTPDHDFIWLKGFGAGTTLTYQHDIAGHADQHLYKVQDGGYAAGFVLAYAGAGVALSSGSWGLL